MVSLIHNENKQRNRTMFLQIVAFGKIYVLVFCFAHSGLSDRNDHGIVPALQ